MWKISVAVSMFTLACASRAADDPGIDAGATCPTSASFCQGRTEAVCEDFDRSCDLDPAWMPLPLTVAGALSLVERSDAASAPRVADVQLPAFDTGFQTAMIERSIVGAFDTVSIEVSWRRAALDFPVSAQGFAGLVYLWPEVPSSEVFVIGFGCNADGLGVSVVASAAGGGNRWLPIGAPPRVGAWQRLRLELTVRPQWSYAAFIDDRPMSSGVLPLTLAAGSRLRFAFGLDRTAPATAAHASFDNVLVDLRQ